MLLGNIWQLVHGSAARILSFARVRNDVKNWRCFFRISWRTWPHREKSVRIFGWSTKYEHLGPEFKGSRRFVSREWTVRRFVRSINVVLLGCNGFDRRTSCFDVGCQKRVETNWKAIILTVITQETRMCGSNGSKSPHTSREIIGKRLTEPDHPYLK